MKGDGSQFLMSLLLLEVTIVFLDDVHQLYELLKMQLAITIFVASLKPIWEEYRVWMIDKEFIESYPSIIVCVHLIEGTPGTLRVWRIHVVIIFLILVQR